MGRTAINPLLSPLGGLFISNTFLEGGLLEMGGLIIWGGSLFNSAKMDSISSRYN